MTRMAKHNKKRNVGLIHEQLVRYVASSLIAEDKQAAEKAVQIITRHFKQGSELYKEFRLFNAMVNMPVGSRSLAERVLAESKNAAKSHSPQNLRKEKSLLIKDINTQLAESRRFYDIKVENYRLFATVQSALNEWRGNGSLELTEKARYEEAIVEWLSRDTHINEGKIETSDPLVRKLMYQKFENKYRDRLSESQKNVLECSILGDDKEFIEVIRETKARALVSLRSFEKKCDNKLLKENISKVREKVSLLEEDKNDDVVAKTLHLVYLIEEMESNE
jgi:hypothetical protein